MSFDGFTADANEKLDWLAPHAPSPDGHQVFTDLRRNVDTVLVGRVNDEGFYQHWPKVQHDAAAAAHDVAISRPQRGSAGKSAGLTDRRSAPRVTGPCIEPPCYRRPDAHAL